MQLVEGYDVEVELLSGEWRALMDELDDVYDVTDVEHRIFRTTISPDDMEEFVEGLRDPERQKIWRPISFGLAELTDALPRGTDLVGLVVVEESDDWLWHPPINELIAFRPEVFALIEPFLRELLVAKDYRALARLAEDHAEGCVEFSEEQWRDFTQETSERAPELIAVIEGRIATPTDYTSIREALGQVANPRRQPSLDAWLRVHAASAQYALYFRDASLEQREFEGSGAFRLDRVEQPLGGARTSPPEVIPTPLPRHSETKK